MQWLGFLAKLIPHAGKLDDLAEAVDALLRADSSRAYWDATKQLGDLLQPVVESVTGFDVSSEESAVSQMGLGDGSRLKKLRDFVESPMGQALIGWLMRKYLPV